MNVHVRVAIDTQGEGDIRVSLLQRWGNYFNTLLKSLHLFAYLGIDFHLC